MRDGSHIPASEFHTRFSVEVEELYEKVKDRPGLDDALAELDKAGLLSPIVVVPKP